MTDSDAQRPPPWLPVLAQISRASGHELRNSLNALVVNLEVVRSRVGDADVEPFLAQSIAQSEESVRLAESAIALLSLIVGAIGEDGDVRADFVPAGGVRMMPSGGESERLGRALRSLADRGAISVDTSDSAVILSLSDRYASTNHE